MGASFAINPQGLEWHHVHLKALQKADCEDQAKISTEDCEKELQGVAIRTDKALGTIGIATTKAWKTWLVDLQDDFTPYIIIYTIADLVDYTKQ